MRNHPNRRAVLAGAGAFGVLAGRSAAAKTYGPGVTDSEIKLGTTSPYSGPASAYGVYGHAQTAYFQMINEQGGINGRKINLISLDNGYNPPKALEQTRKLVEEDNVLAIAGFLGTAPNTSVQKYLNGKKVPNLFLTSGADRFNDPKNYPWIVPLYPTYVGQGEIYARFILTRHPDAKIGVLYINDDLGKDFLLGLKKGLGDRARTMIVREVSNELTDPSVDSQIIDLKGSGADALVQFTTSKFAAQGIRKAYDLGWRPRVHILASVASAIGATLIPAGVERSKGVITARWEKHPTDPTTDRRRRCRRVSRVRQEIHAEPQYRGQHGGAGLHQLGDDQPRAARLRRRADAREHPEAGDQPQGRRRADAAARHHAHELAGRLSRLPRHAARPVRRREVRRRWARSSASIRRRKPERRGARHRHAQRCAGTRARPLAGEAPASTRRSVPVIMPNRPTRGTRRPSVVARQGSFFIGMPSRNGFMRRSRLSGFLTVRPQRAARSKDSDGSVAVGVRLFTRMPCPTSSIAADA